MSRDKTFAHFWNDLVTGEEKAALVAAGFQVEMEDVRRWADEHPVAARRRQYLSAGLWPRIRCMVGRHLWVSELEANIVGESMPGDEESCLWCRRTRNRSGH